MSDRTISEIHEVENGSKVEVIVTAVDENNITYVGTVTYDDDAYDPYSKRNEAYKNATDEAMNGR